MQGHLCGVSLGVTCLYYIISRHGSGTDKSFILVEYSSGSVRTETFSGTLVCEIFFIFE